MSHKSKIIPFSKYYSTKDQQIKLLRNIVDLMSDCFLIWDQDDQLVVCHEKVFEIYPDAHDIFIVGRTFEEVLSIGVERGDFEIPEKVTSEEWVEHRVTLHKRGDYVGMKQAKERWLQIRDQRTAEGYIITTAIDVTHLKRQEKQLEEQFKLAKEQAKQLKIAKERAIQAENHVKDALDTMSDAFVLWDKDDRLILHNEKAFEIYPRSQDLFIPGRTYEEVLRMGLERGDFTLPKDMTKEEWIEYRVAGHKSGNYQNVRYVQGRWLQIRDQRTKHGNIVSTNMNISYLKEREQQLELALKDAELAQAQAEKATQAKSQFLNMMSHEIRTPLQGVVNMSQLLMTSIIEPDQHDKLMTILRSSEALLTTLNDALDIAKVEAGKLTIKNTSFDLKKLIEGVMVMYTLPVQEKNLSFSYSLDPKLPRFLRGDAVKIRQILFNFIDNALKFTPRNGKISVRCEARPSAAPSVFAPNGATPDRTGDSQDKSPDGPSDHDICLGVPAEQRGVKLYMAVTDTGIGISEEAQQRLFIKEFTQADETIAAKFGGCGLGLSICKKMIDSLGGKIGVESELAQKGKPYKGSTFWVMIDGLEKVEHFSPIDWYYGHKEHTKLPSQRILLVEDNVLNQKSTGEVLEYLDHKVTVASDGMEALRELKDKDFDLVITDLQMPRLDGLHLIHSIRALPGPKKDIPIMALTARANEEDARDCVEAGATRHIPKPITMWALQKTMAEVLGYHRETDQTKKEAKRNAYYQEQDQPDDLQLIAVDQSVLKALRTTLSNDEVLEIIDDYQQTVTKTFDQDLPKIIRQEDYAKASDIVRDFRCMSDTLGLSRLVQRLKKLKTAIQNKDQDRIYDYYHQAEEEINSSLPTLKSFFKNEDPDSPEATPDKEANLLLSSTLSKKAFHGIKTLYVFSKDQALKSELQDQLSHYGYDVNVCVTLKKLQKTLSQNKPFLLMIDFDQAKDDDEIARFCQEQQETGKNCYYMMISSSEDDLTIRRKAVQLGARDFYVKPVDYSALVDKLDQLTLAETSEPYRVLIVDDEPNIAKYHSAVLKKAGMVTETITDPLTCIDTLYEFRPDIILMDINMPTCNGVELSYIIRQHQAFVGIPITFLSGERDYAKHVAALEGGGDEFLSKPIDPPRLIESVTLRVERLRKLRSYMIRDSLTGLLNHSTIKDNLATQVLQAERQEIPLSFALIDIDKFKAVNDSYGHPAGDRIIKALSRYLKQHLRRTDIIGRYGGEEFGIILPNTPGKKAKEVIDKVRKGFADLHHAIDKQKTIQVTFSAGIATYPQVKEWSDLIKTADEQLYTAKKQGRNCAVLQKVKEKNNSDR